MGGARKIAAMLPAALLCAAALASCGGGDSSTATSGGAAQPNAEAGSAANGGSRESQQGGSGGGSSKQGSGSGGGSGSEAGGGSGGEERSSSFRTPGGDNSIQEFGEESDAEERAEVTKTIVTLYSASAAKEWSKVCGVLSAQNLKSLKLFAKRIPNVQSSDCPGVLKVVYSNVANPAEEIKGGVVSLRIEGDTGFALYHGTDGKNYAFPLTRENGEWKLTSLGPTPLSF